MIKMTSLVLLWTVITMGLIAGLFYSYVCSVNIGLGLLPDKEYLAAMQSINEAIQNPLFFLSFMGAVILLPVGCFLHYQQPRFTLLLWATIVYLIGAFAVTIFGNVPLNETLAQFNLKSATMAEIVNQRVKFEGAWNKLHVIRTLASIASFVLVILACMKDNDG